MSKEKSWINPCGVKLDDSSSKKRKISSEDSIPNIGNEIHVILGKLKDLRKFMLSKYNYVNEDALKSQEYSFLNIPKNIKNAYVRAYHILQVNVMAIEELLKQMVAEDEDYRKLLESIKGNFLGLLCNVQYILKLEGLSYIDVTEDIMSKPFKNTDGSFKAEKHFIAIRQMEANMEYLSKEYLGKKIKLISEKKLKVQKEPLPTVPLKTKQENISIDIHITSLKA